jgi:hypothetical protein
VFGAAEQAPFPLGGGFEGAHLVGRDAGQGGQGGKSGRFRRFAEAAEQYAFMLDQLGVEKRAE